MNDIDPGQQPLKLHRRQNNLLIHYSRKMKPSFFHAFLAQPESIQMPEQQFDFSGRPTAENIDIAIGRILTELISNHQNESVHLFSKINRMAMEPYSGIQKEKH